MAIRLRHKSAQLRISAMVRQSTVHGVQFTIRHLESNWTMVRDLLVISGTMLKTPLVMILLVTVQLGSKELEPVTTSTSTLSATSLWLDSCNKCMVTEAWSSIMLNASMLSKSHTSTSRRVLKRKKMESRLIESLRSLESQLLLCRRRIHNFLLRLLRLMVTRSLLSRLLWFRKSYRLRLLRAPLHHQMSKTSN